MTPSFYEMNNEVERLLSERIARRFMKYIGDLPKDDFEVLKKKVEEGQTLSEVCIEYVERVIDAVNRRHLNRCLDDE